MKSGKKETLYAFFYSVVSKALTYILLLIFANLYLPEEYGAGNFALNIRNIIMLFSFFGLQEALIPFIIRKKKINPILRFIAFINGTVFFAGLLISYKFPWVLPLAITFPLVMLTSVATAFLRSESKYDLPIKIGVHSIILSVIFAYLLKDYGKMGVVSAYAIGNAYSFVALSYPVRKKMIGSLRKNTSVPFNFKLLRKYLFIGASISLVGSILALISWINSALLGIMGNFTMVAEFGVASAIAGAISTIPLSLSMFMITRASQIKSREKSSRVFHRVMRVSFLTSLLLSILLTTFLQPIIKFFFPQYLNIGIYVVILFVGLVFFSCYYIIYSYHIGKMNVQKIILPAVFGLFVSFFISILLIPSLGVGGVAIASSAAHLAILLITSHLEKMKRIIFMSAFATFSLWLTYLAGYLGILIFILTIPLSITMKIITKEDIHVIKEVVRGVLHIKPR